MSERTEPDRAGEPAGERAGRAGESAGRDGGRVLGNARLADGRTVDVHVVGGMIASVAAVGSPVPAGAESDDLDGWLLLPAPAEPHAHLDKALTAEAIPNPRGDLGGAVEAWAVAAADGRLSEENLVERAAAAVELLVVHGVTAVRSHVNTTLEAGVEGVRALREVRRRFDGLVDLQLVALTGKPITGPDGAAGRAVLNAALEEGVDAVGGCPHLDSDPLAAMEVAFAAARDAGLPLDLHTDETLDPEMLNLRDMARAVQSTGFAHPVAASHCVSLSMASPETQAAVAAEAAAAGIAVITLPQTNLYLQGRDHPVATPRGLTAIGALESAGALVAAGADNVQDPFNLVGRSDPLETAALLVMAAHRSPEAAYDMVSNGARRAMGLAPVRFEPGDPADFMAIDAPSVRAAIADAPMSRRVWRRGRPVASSQQHTRLLA